MWTQATPKFSHKDKQSPHMSHQVSFITKRTDGLRSGNGLLKEDPNEPTLWTNMTSAELSVARALACARVCVTGVTPALLKWGCAGVEVNHTAFHVKISTMLLLSCKSDYMRSLSVRQKYILFILSFTHSRKRLPNEYVTCTRNNEYIDVKERYGSYHKFTFNVYKNYAVKCVFSYYLFCRWSKTIIIEKHQFQDKRTEVDQ